jgi:predicted extracellular nuclease
VFLTARAPARPLILVLMSAMAMVILPAATPRPVLAASPNVVISQVYGGGGNVGATLTQDFIELFNRGSSPVSVGGWTVQYASATGTGNFGANTAQLTEIPPATTLQPGQYLLIHEQSGPVGAPPPSADVTDGSPINLSATAGKVALVNTATPLGCNGSAGQPCSAAALATIVDLVGYGGANFFEGAAAAPVISVTLADGRNESGCADTDQNGSDFTAAAPAPRNSATALHVCPVTDAAPSIVSSSPSDGASNVAKNATLSVTFSESATVADGTILLSCDGTGVPVTVQPGPATTFELLDAPPLPDGASCEIAVGANGVSDEDAVDPPDHMTDDVTIHFTVIAADPCAAAFTPIPAIQGSGETSPFAGQTKTTEGVVVSDDEGPSPTLRGFYLQDPVGDGDPATSDGIFVFNGNNDSVANGDNVRVTGTAEEFQGQTQISSPSIIDCGTDETVTPTNVVFPATSPTSLEAYEGMLVRIPQPMTVTEHFQLGRFGQVLLSSGGKLDNPTAVVAPGDDAKDLQAENNLRKLILDDSSQGQNPDPIVFARGGQPLSASNTLRGGDTVRNLTGVMTYTWAGNAASGNAYRIRPLNAIGGSALFVAVNQRPGTPVEVDGNVRVVGMNLLNYFNTFDGLPDTVDNCRNGLGGPFTDCRGADTQAEFDRQWPKTVQAILGVDADVIGINEVENDGYGTDSAIAHLVGRLNAETGAGTYAFIDVDAETGQVNAAGTDAIKVGVIYRPAAVTPVGTTGALNSAAFVNGGDPAPRSRPSIAQAFETVDGARFIVDVNHFKSKGSACAIADAGDGQGNCNVVRTNAAIALRDWLASDPTGIGDDDILIVGDLNSYAMEDPVTALTEFDEAADEPGYTNLVDEFVEGKPYSYLFDGQWGYLDYALGSETVVDQVAGVVEWHINSDEPSVLDYNLDFKTPNLQTSLYAPDRFRVSDHDPIVVGLNADSDRPIVDARGPYTVEEGGGTTQLTATGSDPTGDDITYAWDLDGDGTFETPGATVTFSAGDHQAPEIVTVTVQITDEHGQSSTDTAQIQVTWDFGGFKPPINGSGLTTVTAGGSQPVKFSLDGFQGFDILDGATLQREDCTTHAAIGSPIAASAGAPLAYDAATDWYKYTWKTQKAWAGWCGSFSLHLADGQSYDFQVRFKS